MCISYKKEFDARSAIFYLRHFRPYCAQNSFFRCSPSCVERTCTCGSCSKTDFVDCSIVFIQFEVPHELKNMSYGRPPPRIDGMVSLKVDNLTYRTTPEDLRRVFERCGEVGDIYIPRDRFTRESRGFAFVRYVKIYFSQCLSIFVHILLITIYQCDVIVVFR